MNYPVKCTHCMPLLLNLKKYAFAHYYLNNGQWYIDVQDERERQIINCLEWYQEGTFEKYRDLEYLTEKNPKL